MIVRAQDLGLSSLLLCGLGVGLWAGWSCDHIRFATGKDRRGCMWSFLWMEISFHVQRSLACACHLQELTVKEGSDWTLGELCLARGTKLNLESLGEIPALCPQSL